VDPPISRKEEQVRHGRTSMRFAIAAVSMALSVQAAAQQTASIATPSSAMPDTEAQPAYGTISLVGGFPTDPYPIGVVAGGPYSAAPLGKDCIGNITPTQADTKIEFANGHRPLSIYAAAGSDVALIVHTPDGQWVCIDDTNDGGTNPALTFERPENGTYAVWVAAVDGLNRPVPAVLVISEFPPTW
jgi:serine protease Do